MSTRHLPHINHIAAPDLGRGVDADLGSLTIVTGRNGRGKTTHLRALALALGRVSPDTLGRDVLKAPGTLKRVLPREGASFLPITATFTDGATATLTSFGAQGHKIPAYAGAPLMYKQIEAVFSGDPDASAGLRTYVLRAACRDMTTADIRGRVPEDLHGVYDSVIKGAESPIEAFLLSVEAVRDVIRAKRTALRGQAEALGLAMASVGVRPTEQAIAAATKLSAQLRQLIALDKLYRTRTTLLTQIKAAEEKRTRIIGQIGALPVLPATAPGTMRPAQLAAVTLLQHEAETHVANCTLCGTPHSAATQAHVTSLQGAIQAYTERNAAAAREYEGLAKIHKEGAAALRAVDNDLATLRAQLTGVVAGLPPGGVNPTEWPGIDFNADLAEQLTAADTAANALVRAAGTWVAIDRIQAEQAELERAITQLGALDTHLASVAPAIVWERQHEFEDRVSAFLGKDERGEPIQFKLLLDDPASNPEGEVRATGICRWGWEINGLFVENISTAQRMRTFLAVAFATIDPASVYNLLLVDRADMDAQTFADVLSVLCETRPPNVQVVIANATPPAGDVGAGVTHIDLDVPEGAPEAPSKGAGVAKTRRRKSKAATAATVGEA